MTYILAVLLGAVAFFAFTSRKQSSADQAYQRENAALDEAIKNQKQAAQQQQETADEAVKKYEEEVRNYDPSIDPPKS